jgi:hypothetical protein
MHHFQEANSRIHSVERIMIDAEDDAANMAELDHEREMERMRARFDRSTALHEFILNARYERDVREGRIVLH